jgi:hypothetical protein
VVYFGLLLLLFIVSDRFRTASGSDRMLDAPGDVDIPLINSRSAPGLLRQFLFPLSIYYATTLGIPVATAVYRSGTAASDFWEHLFFVLLTPLILILPLAAVRWKRLTP